jgi:hypothetical protein
MSRRACAARNGEGEPCRQAPLREGKFCFWHEPDNAEAANEARRVGRARQRREATVAAAYDFEGLDSIPKIRRAVEVAMLDTLSLENSVNRNRTLGSLAGTAAKLLEVGELEDRVAELEAAMGPRLKERRR